MKTTRYSLFLIIYTLLVILWGAWVRISGSGDGCGEHWPLCHDKMIPAAASVPTWIEYSHRLMSGLYGFLVIGLVFLCFREYPRKHPCRGLSVAVFVFTIIEAALGARLVLAGLVADNATIARAYTMALHMLNSLILVASVALTYYWSKKPEARNSIQADKWSVAAGLLFFTIACTGSIAALSGTLFPDESLLAGLQADFASHSHILVRLRVSHPLLATLIGGGLIMFGYLKTTSEIASVRMYAYGFTACVGLGLLFGYATLFLLSPTWMKLTHLLIAHCIWISLLFLLTEIRLSFVRSR